MPVSPDLLDILACPSCKAEVFLDTAGGEFIQCVNPECRRRYDVREDIPVMLIDESTVLESADFEAALSRRPAPQA
jgi:uncharacterized protein YbaR (Trm112 family)